MAALFALLALLVLVIVFAPLLSTAIAAVLTLATV